MLRFEEEIINFFEENNFNYEFDSEQHAIKSGKIVIKLIIDWSSSELSKGSSDNSIISIWPDQYHHKKEIIESRILSKLGKSHRIYGRNTEIRSISQEELGHFLERNHLNAGIKAKYRYGLYNNQKLVAIAAFGRSCPIQQGGNTYRSHELIRYCSLLGITVVGGLSKLIEHFVRNVKPEHIMTYVDREWSDGSAYQRLGFEEVGVTKRLVFWLSPLENERYYAHNLQEDILEQKIKENGWLKVHNQGNIKLVKFLK